MRVFLSGPMGSGKSSLCEAVAARLGLPAYDLDAWIERRSGMPVTQLFEQQGEDAFRAEEAKALEALLDAHSDCVVALGGGTVTQPALRQRMLHEGLLITLMAAPEVLAKRVGRRQGRPLLAGQDPQVRLTALLEERRAVYAECHALLRTDQGGMGDAVERVVRVVKAQPLLVPLGERSYQIEVAAGVRHQLLDYLAEASSVVVVTDDTVAPLWGAELAQALADRGLRVTTVALPAGEANKNIVSVQTIWNHALSFGVDRKSWIVGVGGGVIGDMAGFAAATLLRGISVGHVPTTLLSMVDSAVGGKTGFDTEHGKNLVGAFHQPGFVLADIETLSTLPDGELVAGLSEVVKSAWIDGEASVAMLEQDAQAIVRRDVAALERAIRMSCQLKARIVTADERESGVRALLNLGHTLGHAIEAAAGFGSIRHGEAVALGMVAACRIARGLSMQTADQGQRLIQLLEALGLPIDVDPWITQKTLSYIASDKKRVSDSIKYIVPGGPGEVRVVPMALADIMQRLSAV